MTAVRIADPSIRSDRLPSVLERRLFSPTTAVFGLLAVSCGLLDLARIEVPYGVQVVPFAGSVLLFGLPHGALDHLVPARLDARITLRRSIGAVVGIYVVLGGATALLWRASPVTGFAAFIAVTWFHWGQGDLWLDRERRHTAGGRTDAVLTVLVRGALPMLLPLVTHPRDYAGVVETTARILDRSASVGPALESVSTRLVGAAVLAALLTAHVLLRRRAGRPLRTTALEVVVLTAFFSAVPPVLAVGLYFTFWHAVRHIVRLELLDPIGRSGLARGDLLRPFARFLRDALPITLCAVGLLVVLALVVRSAGLGTYLLLIAALTTPHTAVVTWMKR